MEKYIQPHVTNGLLIYNIIRLYKFRRLRIINKTYGGILDCINYRKIKPYYFSMYFILFIIIIDNSI